MSELSDYIKSHPQQGFKPKPFYNPADDSIHWYWNGSPSYEEPVHHDGVWIGSVSLDMETRKATGAKIFGIGQLLCSSIEHIIPGDELLNLAIKAVAAKKAGRGENVNEWANKLAQQVCGDDLADQLAHSQVECLQLRNLLEKHIDFGEVLRLLHRHDISDTPMYVVDEKGAPHIFINCSDLFWWGSADSEQLNAERLPILEQCLKDVRAIDEHNFDHYESLYCCRIRGMRPQGACYPKDSRYWFLFDDCGPEREVGYGNPRPRPTGEST